MNSKFLKSIRMIVPGMLIVLLTLTLLLIIAEIVTRAFSSIQPPLRIRDLEIGEKYIPDFSDNIFVGESNQNVYLRFHRDGFRGGNREYEKTQKTCRISILGDSHIAAIATEEKKTLVCQLERILNERHPAVKWEVFNFGISAASTAQELVLYKKIAAKYDPDIVICVYFLGNDFSDNCDRLDSYPRIYMDIDENGNLYVKPFSLSRKKLSIWLNEHSRFYVWQKYKFKTATKIIIRSKVLFKVREGDLIYMNKDSEKLNHAWNLNEKIIHAFYEAVVSDNRRFLFAVIPGAVQQYSDSWEEFFAKDKEAQAYLDKNYPDRRLAEIINKKNIDHIFLRDGLGKYINGRPHTDSTAQVLYGGSGHLNVKGNLLSAELIYSHLLNNNTIYQIIDKCFVGDG